MEIEERCYGDNKQSVVEIEERCYGDRGRVLWR